jgi:ABC-type polysaccharide/polyol phosphate export permease
VAVPQSVYPIAVVGSKLVDLLLSLVPLAVVAALLGRPPGPSWILLLPAAVVAAGFAAGLALALSSLTVFFRDVRHLVEVGLQLWFYATPILYPPSALARLGHPALRALLAANPAAPIIALFQTAAYEGRAPGAATALAAVASASISLAGGLLLFRALEPRHVLHF